MRNVASLVAIVFGIAVGSHFAFQLVRAGQPSFLLWIGAPTIAVAVIGAIRAHGDGTLKGWLSVRAGDFTRGFVAAALLFGGAWLFAKYITPLGSVRESWLARLYLQLGDPSLLRKHVGFVVAVLIVMSIAEELVWRGLVVSLLGTVLSPQRAWVWAAVLYALAHVPTLWALSDPVAGLNPILPVAALGGGLVWGFMARRFDRLLPGMFAHVLFDWTVLMMFRLWGPSI